MSIEEIVEKYTYRVEWSEEDGTHVARCAEFPSLAAHGEKAVEVLGELEKVVLETIKWMKEEGEDIPDALSTVRKRSVMVKKDPKDSKTIKMIKEFSNYVVFLKTIHHIQQELFEDKESTRLLGKTAKYFFLDLNIVINEYLLLEMAKITDPAMSINEKYENFTIGNIIESVNWQSDIIIELNKINEEIKQFRKHIKIARNKILAHYDKEIFLSGKILGNFPKFEDKKFIKLLEDICNIVHKECTGEILGEMVVTRSGDVLDLKKILKKALAFDKLWDECSGDELVRLDRVLDKI
ncbi:MAG: hypothetical protein KAU17_07995 [Spirochaetales bacterium]|nr:hypothetical protein [Spirochaetales bacterium]